MTHTLAETNASIIDLVEGPSSRPSREVIPERSALPLKHFRLTHHPFADSVNPDFFFRTEAHEEAFLAMKQCIEDKVSLGLTTAISGTGKTLLTQVLLKELDPRRYQTTLVLAYPGMSRTALLREVVTELEIEDAPERGGVHKLITTIQQHIIKQYLRGIRMVLIIDEVHFLKSDALHILRTLSNIEVPEHKLITVLLFGERSFLKKMKHPTYRAIFSRMFARVEIRPLHRHELEQYIKFRVLLCGGRSNLFDASALDPLHRLSEGVPRDINRLCHVAMGLAAREGLAEISGALIERAATMTPWQS